MSFLGLDLAGVETRPTGICVMMGMRAETSLVYGDQEIVTRIRESKPRIVAIDAPLSLPTGRTSIEQRTNVHLRECDNALLEKRIKFFPITLGPMRKLTERGMRLKRILENLRFSVIEVYPGGAQDVLGVPRKQEGLDKLRIGLEKLGVRGLNGQMSDHELDAVTCAIVGKMWLEGNAVIYGTPEQAIIMPKEPACQDPSKLRSK